MRERPKKVYEKESLKGSRTESLSERARKKEEKERHRAVSSKKNLYKVLEVEVSSSQRTPVLAAGFQLKGSLCHFNQLHIISQRVISLAPRRSRERKLCLRYPLADTSVVLVNAV